EAVGYQSLDLVEAMIADGSRPPAALRVDGGMTPNDWLCQFLADMLQSPVERPAQPQTTAMGVALPARLAAGVGPDRPALARTWARERRFQPRMAAADRQKAIDGWRAAVARTLTDFPGRTG